MPKSDLRIAMLGTSLSISAEADPYYLQQLLGKYQQFVEQTRMGTGLEDPLKLAILSGFLLYDEIEKAKRNVKDSLADSDTQFAEQHAVEQQQAAEQLTLGLITLLEETLGE